MRHQRLGCRPRSMTAPAPPAPTGSVIGTAAGDKRRRGLDRAVAGRALRRLQGLAHGLLPAGRPQPGRSGRPWHRAVTRRRARRAGGRTASPAATGRAHVGVRRAADPVDRAWRAGAGPARRSPATRRPPVAASCARSGFGLCGRRTAERTQPARYPGTAIDRPGPAQGARAGDAIGRVPRRGEPGDGCGV